MKKEQLSRLFAKRIEGKKFNLPDYNNKANVKWIVQHSKINCLKLNIDIPFRDIAREIDTIPDELFVRHRDEAYEGNRGWRSFALHGKAYNATRENNFYNDDRPLIWTSEAIQHCPKTVFYFQNCWPCKDLDRVRIMLLEPNGIINLHKDSTVPGVLGAVNIAITQPSGCKFYLDNFGIIPFNPGDAFLIDVSNYHTIINDSNEHRYHIIVHHNSIDSEFDSVIEKSYNSSYAG